MCSCGRVFSLVSEFYAYSLSGPFVLSTICPSRNARKSIQRILGTAVNLRRLRMNESTPEFKGKVQREKKSGVDTFRSCVCMCVPLPWPRSYLHFNSACRGGVTNVLGGKLVTRRHLTERGYHEGRFVVLVW